MRVKVYFLRDVDDNAFFQLLFFVMVGSVQRQFITKSNWMFRICRFWIDCINLFTIDLWCSNKIHPKMLFNCLVTTSYAWLIMRIRLSRYSSDPWGFFRGCCVVVRKGHAKILRRINITRYFVLVLSYYRYVSQRWENSPLYFQHYQ